MGNETIKLGVVEVGAINLPKTCLGQTPREKLDIFVSEAGNTVGFFALLLGVGGWMNHALGKSTKYLFNSDATVMSQGRVMKSLALIPPLTAWMIAMPFFRNAFTAWKNGITDFNSLISNESLAMKKRSAHSKRDTQEAIRRDLQKGGLLFGAGSLLGLLGFFWGKSDAVRRLIGDDSSRSHLKGLLKSLMLTGPHANEFKWVKATLFWIIPAYVGWMWASRKDKQTPGKVENTELKENLLKMLNCIAVYTLTDKVIYGLFFNRKSLDFAKRCASAGLGSLYDIATVKPGKETATFVYEEAAALLKASSTQPLSESATRLFRRALGFENIRVAAGLSITLLLMTLTPGWINLALRKERLARAHGKQNLTRVTQYPTFHVPRPIRGSSFSSPPQVIKPDAPAWRSVVSQHV